MENQVDSDDSDEEKKVEVVKDDWVSVIYTVNILLKESEIQAKDFRAQFKMGRLNLIGQVDFVKDDSVDD